MRNSKFEVKAKKELEGLVASGLLGAGARRRRGERGGGGGARGSRARTYRTTAGRGLLGARARARAKGRMEIGVIEEDVRRRLNLGALGGHAAAGAAPAPAAAFKAMSGRAIARAISLGASGVSRKARGVAAKAQQPAGGPGPEKKKGGGAASPTSPGSFPRSPLSPVDPNQDPGAGDAVTFDLGKPAKAGSKQLFENCGICIEGNIGVGKSTLLRMVSSDTDMKRSALVCEEPIDQWQNVNGSEHNLLDAFYRDPHRHAYLFQNYAFITRFLQHHRAAQNVDDGEFKLLERSVFTDRFVFAKTCAEQGLMTPLEWNVYLSWFNPILSTLPDLVPEAFIYLRASAEVCQKRLCNRARSEEAGVALDYLKLIHEKHEDWFIKRSYPAEMGADGEVTVEGPLGAPAGGARVTLRVLDGPSTLGCLQHVPVIIVSCEEQVEDVSLEAYSRETLLHYLRKLKLY